MSHAAARKRATVGRAERFSKASPAWLEGCTDLP
jgi:hypothetical protein